MAKSNTNFQDEENQKNEDLDFKLREERELPNEPDWDLEAKQAREDAEEKHNEARDAYFEREPDNFGGGSIY